MTSPVCLPVRRTRRFDVALFLLQGTKADHAPRSLFGVAGGDRVLECLAGLPGPSVLVLKKREVEHRLGRVFGVAGGDSAPERVTGLWEAPLLLLNHPEVDHGQCGIPGRPGCG